MAPGVHFRCQSRAWAATGLGWQRWVIGCCLAAWLLLPVEAADPPATGRVLELVTPKVVMIQLGAPDWAAGLELELWRADQAVGRLRLRAGDGLCQVLQGEAQVGDLVRLARPLSADPPATGSVAVAPPPSDTGGAQAAARPPWLQALFEAEALAHFGQYASGLWPAPGAPAPTERAAFLGVALSRLAAGTPRQRVVAWLRLQGWPELAEQVAGEAAAGPAALAPAWAPLQVLPTAEGPRWQAAPDQVPVLTDDPTAWRQPQFWGRPARPPDLSGWRFGEDQMDLSESAQPLWRPDWQLDDFELSGELQVQSGQALYLILRGALVLKFQGGAESNNLRLKYGFDNLSQHQVSADGPALRPNIWQAFRVSLRGSALTLTMGNEEALTVTLPELSPSGARLPGAGPLGLGAYRAAGAFRGLRVRPLSLSSALSLPRHVAPVTWEPEGEPLAVLQAPRKEFQALSHQRVEPWQEAQHALKDGILEITGAPYHQFSHPALTGEHWQVRATLRASKAGTVWLRLHPRLLLGLRAEPPAKGEQTPQGQRLVKFSTANLHTADQLLPGVGLRLNQWQTITVTYHAGGVRLDLEGQPIIWAMVPPPEGEGESGVAQFGVSAYNTPLSVRELRFQRLRPRLPAAWAQLGQSWPTALAERLAQARTLLAKRDAEAQTVAQHLAAPAQAALASPEELSELAQSWRAELGWPATLRLWQVAAEFYPKDDPRRTPLEARWQSEQRKFQLAQETLEPGELGLDGVLRLGRGPVVTAPAAAGGVWLYLAASQELHRYDAPLGAPAKDAAAAGGQGVGSRQKLKLTFAPTALYDRGDYLILLDGAGQRLLRLSLPAGQVTGELALPGRSALDLVAWPAQPLGFVALDEQRADERLLLRQYRVHALNETSMTLQVTAGAGQILAVDPAGRYLYTAFSMALSPNEELDPEPFAIQPRRARLEHLMQWEWRERDLVLLGEAPSPSLHPRRLLPAPDGLYLALDATGGSFDPKHGHRPSAVLLLPSEPGDEPQVAQLGAPPQTLCWRAGQRELLVLAGQRLHRLRGAPLRPVGSLPLPRESLPGPITQLWTSPDGRWLLLAGVGETQTGVLFMPLPGHEGPAGTLADWLQTLQDTGTTQARYQQQALVARQASWSPAGEAAATALLAAPAADLPAGLACPWWAPVAAPWQPALAPLTELAEGASLPPLVEATTALTRTQPLPSDAEWALELRSLLAYRQLGQQYPQAWLWRAWELWPRLPATPALLPAVVEHLVAHDRLAAATHLLGQHLAQPSPDDWRLAVKLAELLQQAGEPAGALAAWQMALARAPRRALVHAGLAAACEAAALPRRGLAHWQRALELFPSHPGARTRLAALGLLPAPPATPEDPAALFAQVAPAIPLIRATDGVGTGFLISRGGLVLTNHHVVGEATEVSVVLRLAPDQAEQSFTGHLLARDARRDLALLHVPGLQGRLAPLLLAPPAAPRTGERVLVIGHPGMGAQVLTHTLTEGLISNAARRVAGQDYVQLSAAVNPGNSGGPVLRPNGQVLGMVTLKAALENVGFAVPLSVLYDFLAREGL